MVLVRVRRAARVLAIVGAGVTGVGAAVAAAADVRVRRLLRVALLVSPC